MRRFVTIAAVRRGLGIILAIVISAIAAMGALRVTLPADTQSGVRRQLATLRQELDGGAADTAQASFPEGYFLMYVLYGLTEVQVGLGEPPAERAEQVREAHWALTKADSAEGRAPFDPTLVPAYGIFYRGWLNWLRGGVLALKPDPAEQARFEADSAQIAAAFDDARTPFLMAYPGRSWPVDSTVAIASLHLHDTLFQPRYPQTVSHWLAAAKQHLDPATGLLPHETDAVTAATIDGARGSSQSMLLRFLAEIDPTFARAQYLRFRSLYQAEPLALGPAVREYPTGSKGTEDVDSGPLILGVSIPATVVTIGAARVMGDTRLSGALSTFGDLAGFPIDTLHTRQYAFGVEPLGEAFLAWSKSARLFAGGPTPQPIPPSVSRRWQVRWLILFLLVGATPWLIAARRRGRARLTQERQPALSHRPLRSASSPAERGSAESAPEGSGDSRPPESVGAGDDQADPARRGGGAAGAPR